MKLARTLPGSLALLIAGAGVTSAEAPPKAEAVTDGEKTHDTSNLSQKATDPTASLLTINLIADFTRSIWGSDETRTTLKIQPVVPFKLWGVPNIARVILPYQLSGPGPAGLADVSLFDVAIVPLSSWGRLAVGSVFNFAGRDSDNPAKFAGGPAAGLVIPVSADLTAGLFTQTLFGDELQLTQLQPILAYQLGSGWSISAGDLQFTIDWAKGRWANTPIGVQLGVVYPILGQPTRFFVSPQYNLKDQRGTDRFKVLVGIALLAPES